MSKFLKFIVNLFLICAILIAAAIIVPPLVGISTTIVDSQTMNTNLPMGSITYAKDVYATDISVGDRILAEDDLATYEYIVDEVTGTGRFMVHESSGETADRAEIQILNSASKVVLTVPYIGYIMYAMRSIEGIIIIALVVLLMIILFILSELWRKDEDEDDEDAEEEERDTALSIPETEALELQNAVDITPYMNDGVEVQDERVIPTEDMDADPEMLTALEEVLSEGVKEQPEEEASSENADEVPIPTADVSSDESEDELAEMAAELLAAEASITGEAPPETEEVSGEAEENLGTVPEVTEESGESDVAGAEAISFEAEISPNREEDTAENTEAEENDIPQNAPEEVFAEEMTEDVPEIPEQDTAEEAGIDIERLQKELEAVLEGTEEADAKTKEEMSSEEEILIAEDAETPAPEEILPEEDFAINAPGKDTPAVEQEAAEEMYLEIADAEGRAEEDEQYLDAVAPEEMPDPYAETFIPVKRPSLDEILESAEGKGLHPEVTKDPVTGISIVDYSELL